MGGASKVSKEIPESNLSISSDGTNKNNEPKGGSLIADNVTEPPSASSLPSKKTEKIRNPSQAEIDKEIKKLAKQHNIPVKVLMALFDAESDFKQFDSSGNPLMPDPKKFPNSSAVGIGQITKYTAKLWGMDYKKLQTDWKYNMANSVKIFEWGGTITSGIAVA